MIDRIPYWNPYLETLPRDRLRGLQLKKFKRIFEWTYNNSKLHRKLYDEAQIRPEDIRTIEDIRYIPKTEKNIIESSQRTPHFPYGESLCVSRNEVTGFHRTSGTTGRPLYQADSWTDWQWWIETWAYILWAQGYRPNDRVFIPFRYNQFIAFWAGHYAAEKIGCEVISGGGINTVDRLSRIQELQPTAMMGTPSGLLNMAEIATATMGCSPSDFNIHKITCAGEPGASIPPTKNRIEAAWGATVFDHAGATEIGAWSYECDHRPCGMHVNEAFFFVEIEDVETGKPIESPNLPGKMIITAFDRTAQPCVRYDSKDIIVWDDKECSCGRTFRLIKGGVLGRIDDLIKVKGVLLSPAMIEEVVRSINVLGHEFETVIENSGSTDKLTLSVELQSPIDNTYGIRQHLIEKLRQKTGLTFEVKVQQIGKLSRYESKSKRLKDLRCINV